MSVIALDFADAQPMFSTTSCLSPARSEISFSNLTESRTSVPRPFPDIAIGPVSVRVVIVLSERNACVPTEETVRSATVTLAASVTSLSALPKTTESPSPGHEVPSPPVQFAGSDHLPVATDDFHVYSVAIAAAARAARNIAATAFFMICFSLFFVKPRSELAKESIADFRRSKYKFIHGYL